MSSNVKKAGKISGIVTSMMTLALIMVVNVQIGLHDGNTTDIGLFGLKASVFVPTMVASSQCISGGPGATSCSIKTWKFECSVTCGDGYYACCGEFSTNPCRCIEGG